MWICTWNKKEKDMNCLFCKQLNNKGMDRYPNERMQQEMELQLHEQYAINNNANLSSAITIIVTLLAVFYAYGYVFLNSCPSFCWKGCWINKEGYSAIAFFFVTLAVFFVLSVLSYICIKQGVKQRYDQFIIYAIRRKYYTNCKYDLYKEVYDDPQYYSPFNKLSKCKCHSTRNNCKSTVRDGLRLVQGQFGEFVKIFTASSLIIMFLSIMKFILLDQSRVSCVFLSLIVFIVFCTDLLFKCIVLKNEMNKYLRYVKHFR